MLRAGLALAVLVLAAPAAEAGMRIESVQPLAAVLEADVESTLVISLGEVDCSSLLLRRPPNELGLVEMHSGWSGETLALSGASDHMIDPAPCQAGASVVPINVTYNAIVLGGVEPLVPQQGMIWWDFADHPLDGQDPVHAEGAFTLSARPVLVPQVNFPAQLADMADEPRTFVVTLVNLGNVAFRATGEALMHVDHGGQPGKPANVTVGEAEVPRGAQGILTVTADVPAGRWTTAQVFGNLTFTSVLDGAGQPRVVPFQFMLVRVGDAPKSVPVEPVFPLLAVAAAAWTQRRRTS